jgi:hypothetical protein
MPDYVVATIISILYLRKLLHLESLYHTHKLINEDHSRALIFLVLFYIAWIRYLLISLQFEGVSLP